MLAWQLPKRTLETSFRRKVTTKTRYFIIGDQRKMPLAFACWCCRHIWKHCYCSAAARETFRSVRNLSESSGNFLAGSWPVSWERGDYRNEHRERPFGARGLPKIALLHLQKALEINEKCLGPSHVSVAHILSNIGVAQYYQRNWKEALENYFKALNIQLSEFGPDHPAVALTKKNENRNTMRNRWPSKELSVKHQNYGKMCLKM